MTLRAVVQTTSGGAGGGSVNSVTAGDGTIVVGGTPTDPTVSANVGTTASTVAAGDDSRLSNDRVASGLRSATTVVSVSGAAAPTAGQVLKAVNSTTATWQADTIGTGTVTSVAAGDDSVTIGGTPTVTPTVAVNPVGAAFLEAAQDAVGVIVGTTATVGLTYNDATPSVTANVVAGSIGPTQRALPSTTTAAASALDDIQEFGDTSNSGLLRQSTILEQSVLQFMSEYPRRVVRVFSDFEGAPAATGDSDGFVSSTGSGGAVNVFASDGNRIGVVQLSTGATNASGRGAVISSLSAFVTGLGPLTTFTSLRVPTLSNATDRFALLVGFCNTNTAVNQTDGIYFIYNEGGVGGGGVASPNWQIATVAASTRTFQTTSVAVPASSTTMQRLAIEVNAAGTSVEFFIDGSSVGTSTTNIPTTGRFGCVAHLIKSAGAATAVFSEIDYLGATLVFTTPR